MKLLPKQSEAYKKAHSGKYNVILYGGAIRGGKTYWLLITLVSFCFKYPKSRWLVLRESLPTLKRTTLVTFQELIDTGLSEFIKDFNKDTWAVTFLNGSQLLFMTENFDADKDLNRFKGLEINGGGLDEIDEMNEKTFYKVIERAGSWRNLEEYPHPIVLATCNPSHNWVKQTFYNRWVEGTLPESWSYIPAKITDNIHIPEEYRQSLKANMLPEEYERFVQGDWEVTGKVENAFATQFTEEKHTSFAPEYDYKKQLVIAMDFNLNPFAVTFSHIWTDKDGYHDHQFDEAEIENGSIPAMADLINLRYKNSLPNCILTGDAMGNRGDISQRDNATLYLQLKRLLGLHDRQIQVSGNPTHENSRADVNYYLFHCPDFKIHKEKCPNTIRDMKSVQCDAFGSILKRDRKNINQRADYLDTIRYKIHNVCYQWIDQHQNR